MKVAFTSSDGTLVDRHFGASEAFYLWEVGPQSAQCLGRLDAPADRGDQEDRIVARATALAGCTMVCTTQIGGPAAAKLVARQIHPLTTAAASPVAAVVERLQGVLRGCPPPWLRKATNQDRAVAAKTA
jgi:nitrogen fixation protein NifX